MDMSTMPSPTSMHTPEPTSMNGDSMSMAHESMTMPTSSMVMTFFESTSTSLFSTAWTPGDAGQYAGTCIFLIALAVAFRGLIAIRSNMPVFLAWASPRLDGARTIDGPYEGIDEEAKLSHLQGHETWRFGEPLARAVLDTVLGGVSYLL